MRTIDGRSQAEGCLSGVVCTVCLLRFRLFDLFVEILIGHKKLTKILRMQGMFADPRMRESVNLFWIQLNRSSICTHHEYIVRQTEIIKIDPNNPIAT